MNAGLAVLLVAATFPGEGPEPLTVCDLYSSHLQSADCRFREGIRLRENGSVARNSFVEAEIDYDKYWVGNSNDRSRSFVLNRARAHFLADNLPQSIRAFREGLAVYPWDAELQRGLALARAAVAYPVETEPAARVRPEPPAELRNRVSPFDLFLASVVSSLFLTVGLARRFTARDRWAWPVAALGLLGVLAVAGAWWQCDREGRRDREPHGLVLIANTVLRTGNGPSFSPRVDAPLPQGAEVREVGRRGGWVQVELPGGAMGWVPESAVLKVGEGLV